MNHCDDCLSLIDLYLDGELRDDDLKIFQDHLGKCASCRKRLEDRQLFLESVRSSRPLSVAPGALHDRISQLLEQEQSATPLPRPAFWRSAKNRKIDGRPVAPSRSQSWLRPLTALAASAAVVASIGVLWTISERQARANAFVETAITTHTREIAGQLPLELRTNSEAEITQWFTRKVPFRFRLPNYSQGQKQKDLYTLRGSRLVAFKGDYAAYVAYRIGPQPISLLVTSTSSAIASGGEATMSKGIAFHSHRRDGLQVFTWSVHGLTYALVSSVSVSGRQSCVVCHADSKGRELLRGARLDSRHVANKTLDYAAALRKQQ